MKRVMIDLETGAVVKNAAILSIGACTFSDAGVSSGGFYKNVTLESCKEVGLVIDESTSEWWQRPEQAAAREALVDDPVHIRTALVELRMWLLSDTDPDKVEPWANGTSFDLAILETAYRFVGIPIPWKFFNERDYRTMKALFKIPKPTFEGQKHTALADARFQAEHLVSILKCVAPSCL